MNERAKEFMGHYANWKPTPKPRADQPAGLEAKREAVADKVKELFVKDFTDDLLRQIEEAFEKHPDARERLPYHNTKHTKAVIDRTENIMRAIQETGAATKHDVLVAKLAAAAHDVVQKWAEDPRAGALMRKRFVGVNEALSVDTLLDKVNEEAAKRGFEFLTVADKQHIKQAVEATVPGWDLVNKTVLQPKLTRDSHPVVRAVALADLGEAGMDPEGHLETGNTIFQEENLDMLGLDLSAVLPEQQAKYAERIMNWTRSQATFADGRRKRLEEELGTLPDAARANVRALFTQFDESIRRSNERTTKRESMAFKNLYVDVYGAHEKELAAK